MLPYFPDKRRRIVDTINLSATGSKKAPNAVEICHRRAKYPSNQSVNEAKANKEEFNTDVLVPNI